MPADAMLRMACGLVLVILAILACAWLARRAGMGAAGPRRILREVDSLRLGPRHRIALVQVEDTWLVVGVSAAQMNVLHTLPAGTEPAQAGRALHTAAQLPGVAGGFAALLARTRSRAPD